MMKPKEYIINDSESDKMSASDPSALYGNKYNYGDYLKFDFEEMVELIKGKIFKMSPAPSLRHQKMSMSLAWLIRSYLDKKECEIFSAPFDVILPIKNEKYDTATTVVQPDLCIVCDQTKLQEAGCFGPPDLVIEILSKSTTKKDLNDKYNIYEEAGVKEYWIVMPNERLVEVFTLKEDKYHRVHTYYEEEVMAGIVFPDMKIDLREVFPQV